MNINSTYGKLCDIAYTVENVILQKELNKEKQENSVIAGISLHAEETNRQIKSLQQKVTELEKSKKEQITNSGNQTQEIIPTIAAVSNVYDNRSASAGRLSRPPSQLQFKIPLSRSQSTESNFNQTNSFNRGRSGERRFSQGNNNFRPQSHSPGLLQGNTQYPRQGNSQYPSQFPSQYPSQANQRNQYSYQNANPNNQYSYQNAHHNSQNQVIDPRSPQPAFHPRTFPQRFQTQSTYQPQWQRNPNPQNWNPRQTFVNQNG